MSENTPKIGETYPREITDPVRIARREERRRLLDRQAVLLLLEEEDGGKSSNCTFMTALDGSAGISRRPPRYRGSAEIPAIPLVRADDAELFRVEISGHPDRLTIVHRLPMLFVAVL